MIERQPLRRRGYQLKDQVSVEPLIRFVRESASLLPQSPPANSIEIEHAHEIAAFSM